MKTPPKRLSQWSSFLISASVRKEKAVAVILNARGNYLAAMGHEDTQKVITATRTELLERQPLSRTPFWFVLYVENEFRLASVDGFNYSDYAGFKRLMEDGTIEEKLKTQEEKLKERNYTYGQARDGTSGDHLGP